MDRAGRAVILKIRYIISKPTVTLDFSTTVHSSTADCPLHVERDYFIATL